MAAELVLLLIFTRSRVVGVCFAVIVTQQHMSPTKTYHP